MSSQRIVGIALLVLGIGLLIVGMNSSNSVTDQVANTFLGRFTQTTTMYILGGAVSAIVGFSMMVVGLGAKRA